MKPINIILFFLAITCLFLGCKKGGDEGAESCEEKNTTIVVFTNTGTVPLRVAAASSLTSQFEPIDPVLSIDVAPQASVSREIEANKYFILWYSNCADECTRITNYSKTYAACTENEEKQGF